MFCFMYLLLLFLLFDGQGVVLLVKNYIHTQMDFRLHEIVLVLLYHIHKVVARCNSFWYGLAYSKLVYDGVSISSIV